ncbi:hypothetical protein PISMIDRAFT_673687 [Pisolithus microcarpus 441]|uniref:Uncharacterized protein n=1 Tax=Pisolithus microcarpus 441 TaxID=765257 RepID=A0A0C9YUF4_9AGAM|nr:hypothetical protein PISMIDRAFT_673687 [Pisolithus microcarpus 441]
MRAEVRPFKLLQGRLTTPTKAHHYAPLTVIAASDHSCTTSISKRQTHLRVSPMV